MHGSCASSSLIPLQIGGNCIIRTVSYYVYDIEDRHFKMIKHCFFFTTYVVVHLTYCHILTSTN